jgi:hypothetical protein
MLGIILTTNEPHATTIHDNLHKLCIVKHHLLLIFGIYNTFTIHLHVFFPNNDPNCITLGRTMNSSNHQLHLTSQFKIIHNIRIHTKFLRQHRNIAQATLGLNKCMALFCDFTSGHGNLHITTIFNAGHTTSFLYPETVTSRIINHLSHVLDLTSSTLPRTANPFTPTRQSYVAATTTCTPPGFNSPT